MSELPAKSIEEGPTTALSRPTHTGRWTIGALACYLALAVFAYWGAWSGGAARTSLCGGCGDIALNSWFLAWTPFAVLHLHNPLVTTWINYPQGANLLANTSILLPGFLATPVTLLFGPLASFNLLATLALAVSAASAFFVLRRFAPWPPAAFVGGLLYGFSPYMVNQGYAHLNLTLVAIPPLILLVLEEVVVRQRGRPVPWGIALGLLVVAQFFTSTEILTSTAIMAAIGIVALLLDSRGTAVGARRHATSALLVAGGTAAVLLAVPLYFLLYGPQHLKGPAQQALAVFSANLGSPIVPQANMLFHTASSAALATAWFGSTDFFENGTYLGIPLLILVVLVGLRFWRERVVRFGLVMAIIAFVLALGPRLHAGAARTGIRLPFAVFEHVPLLSSLIPVRFMLYVDLFVALLVAVGIDRARTSGLWESRRKPVSRASLSDEPMRGGFVTLLGLAALIPLIPAWPYATLREVVPTWFASGDVKAVPMGEVVVTYPFPAPYPSHPMLWQAQAGMRYRIPEGFVLAPGSGGRASFNANPTMLQTLLGDYYNDSPVPALSPGLVAQARADLEGWHTWAVVVTPERSAPNPTALFQGVLRGAPTRALALFQQILGEPPRWHDGVAVWTDCPAAPGEHLTGPGSLPPGNGKPQ